MQCEFIVIVMFKRFRKRKVYALLFPTNAFISRTITGLVGDSVSRAKERKIRVMS